MTMIKTFELIGPALNWAVGKCEGVTWWAAEIPKDGLFIDYGRTLRYRPSTDWAQGGPIVERECMHVFYFGHDAAEPWVAATKEPASQIIGGDYYPDGGCGPTPLVAAMRCYVASKLGEAIEIPEELA